MARVFWVGVLSLLLSCCDPQCMQQASLSASVVLGTQCSSMVSWQPLPLGDVPCDTLPLHKGTEVAQIHSSPLALWMSPLWLHAEVIVPGGELWTRAAPLRNLRPDHARPGASLKVL